jgi:hypothetical protein
VRATPAGRGRGAHKSAGRADRVRLTEGSTRRDGFPGIATQEEPTMDKQDYAFLVSLLALALAVFFGVLSLIVH